MLRRFFANYLHRHRHRVNQWLHLLGVPLTFVVSSVFLVRQNWSAASGCFVGGSVLQLIGHAIEGNDAGEVILLKKLLGKPYVEFGPGHGASIDPTNAAVPPSEQSKSDESSADTSDIGYSD